MGAVEQAVGVLHADDPGGEGPLLDVERHAAEADRPDLALLAQRDQLGQLVVEVDDLIALGLHAEREIEPAQVHHVDAVDAELLEIGLHGGAQFGGLLRCGDGGRVR